VPAQLIQTRPEDRSGAAYSIIDLDLSRYDRLASRFRKDQEAGLSKMSIDISKALFRKLATQGAVFNKGTFRTLKASYFRIALDFVETYNNDAIMNGLDFDTHEEEEAVEMFARNIIKAGKVFLDQPMETPFIPSWNRVVSAIPDVFDRLVEAVEADHEQFAV
jgi:glucosyl-3-phosphoglycerate synthase